MSLGGFGSTNYDHGSRAVSIIAHHPEWTEKWTPEQKKVRDEFAIYVDSWDSKSDMDDYITRLGYVVMNDKDRSTWTNCDESTAQKVVPLLNKIIGEKLEKDNEARKPQELTAKAKEDFQALLEQKRKEEDKLNIPEREAKLRDQELRIKEIQMQKMLESLNNPHSTRAGSPLGLGLEGLDGYNPYGYNIDDLVGALGGGNSQETRSRSLLV